MEITLDLPDRVVRKIKALSVLSGGNSSEIEPLLVNLIDSVLTTSIAEQIGVDTSYGHSQNFFGGQPTSSSIPTNSGTSSNLVDVSGITDGLGDDEDEAHGEEHDAEALVARSGGLSDDDLLNDMQVDDPDHEAKVEAPQRSLYGAAEDVFANIADMPPPPQVTPTLRQQRRKKEVRSRGKVSLATEADV